MKRIAVAIWAANWLAVVLAASMAANAMAMLASPQWWYGAVPGVTGTGPFNLHFIRDIGMAYLVVAGGLGWFAWRPGQGWAALVAAAAFLSLHSLVHVADAIASPVCGQDLIRDLPVVFAPALAALWLAVRFRPKPGDA